MSGDGPAEQPAVEVEEVTAERIDYRILLPVCLTLFMAGMWGQAFAPLIPQIAMDLDVSVALVGQASTVTMAMMGLGSLVSGPVADRFGHRRSILLGLGGSTLVALLYASAPVFAVMLAAAVLGGLAFSMVHGVSFGIVMASFTGDVQRRAMSFSQATLTSASILGAPILTVIAAAIRWRATFVVVAAVLALALVVVARLIPADHGSPQVKLSPRAILHSEEPLLGHRPTSNLYLAAVLRTIGFGGPSIFIAAFLIDVHGFSLPQVGLVLMVAGIGIFAGNLVTGGRWLSGYDLRLVYTLATSLLGFGWLLILTVEVPAIAAVGVLALTYFIGGISFVSRMTLLAEVSSSPPATTMTLNTAMLALGTALGFAIAGLLLSLGGYPLIGVVMPFFTLTAAALVWLTPRPDMDSAAPQS